MLDEIARPLSPPTVPMLMTISLDNLLDLSIRSVNDLTQVAPNQWRTTGPDPYFELEILETASRFAKLSAIISADKDRINSKLYLGPPSYRSEDRVIAHSNPNRSIHSYIVDLRKDGCLLRLDPHNCSALISLDALHAYEYDSDEKAALAMQAEILRRMLGSASRRFRSMSRMCVTDLYDEYIKILARLSVEDRTPFQLWQEYVEKSWFNDLDVKRINCSRNGDTIPQPESPFFSIVVPVYNPKVRDLIECVDSVKSQTYGEWELILVDDASTRQEIPRLLKKMQSTDKRIKVLSRSSNGHISAATNDGIRASKGKYICLVDNDDMLSKYALQEIHEVLQTRPSLKLIYSDEDLMSELGERLFPHFKTDWNPELLCSHNYITHLCCIRADLLKKLELRLGYEGSQDYDLILRIAEQVNECEVYHIPKILYHWRMSSTSTAFSPDAKNYTVKAGQKALEEHLVRSHKQATVYQLEADNFYKLEWPIPKRSDHNKGPRVSIIIPTRNSKDLVGACIESIIQKTEYEDYEVIIADNDSDDLEALAYFDQLTTDYSSEFKHKVRAVRCPGPFNYSAINNTAVKSSSAEFICLLNNDTTVINGEWLGELVSHAARPEVGCVGAKLFYPDNTIQHAGIVLGIGGAAGHSHKGWPGDGPGYFNRLKIIQQVAAVTGACLVIKRNLFIDLGGLDEVNFAVACNDVDLCLKAWEAGYKNIFTPFAKLYHHESKTRGYEDTPEKRQRYEGEKATLIEKWSRVLARDPFYSDHLTLDREDFSTRIPPGH